MAIQVPSLPSELKGLSLPFVSFLIPARESVETLENCVEKIETYLESRFGQNYEIVLIPNPAPVEGVDLPFFHESDQRNFELCQRLARQSKRIICSPHLYPSGKYAALKTGFKRSSGDWIFFTDADLPFELGFFDQAILSLLNEKTDLICGNRRLDESRSVVPAHLLGRFLVRDILSRLFNFATRIILPSLSSWRDTQAGIKALNRETAELVFEKMTCPGFFGDLEILLTAIDSHSKIQTLPVILHVSDNKTSVRFVRDAFSAISWLARIRFRHERGLYRGQKNLRLDGKVINVHFG